MKLQLLLHPHRRNTEAVTSAKQVAQSLGIRPTTEGRATISGEIDPEKFESLFGTVRPQPSSDPGLNPDLPIPESLKEYVQSISIAPQHTYMNNPKQNPA